MIAMQPSFEQVSALLGYDPETGIFRWKVARGAGIKAGDIAGSAHNKGYRHIRFFGRRHLSHRVAWLLSYGDWPQEWLDHINGDRSDNRIVNLRIAGPIGNARNARMPSSNTTGFKGVSKYSGKKWKAQIGINRKRVYLGVFDTKEAAFLAYKAAAVQHHGRFANFGAAEGERNV